MEDTFCRALLALFGTLKVVLPFFFLFSLLDCLTRCPTFDSRVPARQDARVDHRASLVFFAR